MALSHVSLEQVAGLFASVLLLFGLSSVSTMHRCTFPSASSMMACATEVLRKNRPMSVKSACCSGIGVWSQSGLAVVQ